MLIPGNEVTNRPDGNTSKGLWFVTLVNGQSVSVTRNSVPVGIKIDTARRPVEVQTRMFATMPANEDTIIIGRVTMEINGI